MASYARRRQLKRLQERRRRKRLQVRLRVRRVRERLAAPLVAPIDVPLAGGYFVPQELVDEIETGVRRRHLVGFRD